MNEIVEKPHNFLNRRRGQGMTEYLLIVALVAIGAIGVVTVFGNNIRSLFGMSNDALAGDQQVAKRTTKNTAAQEGKDITKFGQNNQP